MLVKSSPLDISAFLHPLLAEVISGRDKFASACPALVRLLWRFHHHRFPILMKNFFLPSASSQPALPACTPPSRMQSTRGTSRATPRAPRASARATGRARRRRSMPRATAPTPGHRAANHAPVMSRVLPWARHARTLRCKRCSREGNGCAIIASLDDVGRTWLCDCTMRMPRK